jgi:DNA-binding NarL/FixJ family response regulator
MSVEPNSRQPTPVRVVVADDDPLVRTAVRRAVTGDSRLRVEGEATNAHQAIDLIRRLRPDVILLDSDLPGLDVISITRRIHGVAPDVSVVVFASDRDDDQALLGLRAGAVGVLGKGVPMEALARSLVAVKRGEAPIPRRLSAALMRRVRETPAAGVGLRPVRSALTPREWQVMDLMCADHSTTAIADQLAVSVETVRSHVRSVCLKFDVHSRAEAVDACRRLRA